MATYFLKTDKDKQLSKNFKVREFACKDGSDSILIDEKLVDVLQRIRDILNVPVNINSAYRTESHNKKVGGSVASMHLEGKAADIVARGKSPQEIAEAAEKAGANFIELYDNNRYGHFVHIDTRINKYRCIKREDGTVGYLETFLDSKEFAINELKAIGIIPTSQSPQTNVTYEDMALALHKMLKLGR